jgi:hypothetical protein
MANVPGYDDFGHMVRRQLLCGLIALLDSGRSISAATKGKGCDFGYALADNSRERVPSVDACTVTALDAITAFAVPNPG